MRASLQTLVVASAGLVFFVSPAAAQTPSPAPGATMGRPPVIYKSDPGEAPMTRSLDIGRKPSQPLKPDEAASPEVRSERRRYGD
jgi:hypothetical protein